MRALPLVVALGVLAAGCLAQEEPVASGEVAPAGVVIDEARPDTAFGEVVTGPAVGPDLNATLDAPPRLVAGEWWRLALDGDLGQPVEVVRVVAEVTDEGYVFGMPHEGWYKELISFHSPALGDVGFDLSYATHNEVFQPVKFPLVEGATWDTVFATAPLRAEVTAVDGPRATIVLTPTGEPTPMDPLFAAVGFEASPITVVYDAGMHEVVSFTSSIGGYEVVEHGYGFEGWVTIPRGEHTAIDYGQIGPVTPGQVGLSREIPVEGGYNRMTLMHAVIPIGAGVFRVRAVAPDGTEFVTEATTEPTLRFYEAKDPDGAWLSEDIVAGVGATYSMGIAYHQYDIRLPDGIKRSDHSHEVVR